VEMRAQVERKMAQKEKEKHEEKLREMAQKARERRAGIKTHVEKGMTFSLWNLLCEQYICHFRRLPFFKLHIKVSTYKENKYFRNSVGTEYNLFLTKLKIQKINKSIFKGGLGLFCCCCLV
jgi:hypothetical protein